MICGQDTGAKMRRKVVLFLAACLLPACIVAVFYVSMASGLRITKSDQDV